MDFKLQTVSKTPSRELSTAISHLLKLAFTPEKRENTLKLLIRFLTDNKSLSKNVESSAKAVYKKIILKIFIPLMSAKFLINSKIAFKTGINRYVDMGPPWLASFSK